MGRGRQRARQAKIARELKYFSPDTDFQRLQQELHTQDPVPYATDEEYDDEYDNDEDLKLSN